jgi:2-desacetyl-2-hydroxyethyl bacteriochlorophyllide A dehydrogenase
MKAACYKGMREISCEEVEKPVIQEPTDIIVKVKACGICGSDLHSYKLGLFPEISLETPKGRIPGHEFSGDVVEVGSAVEGIKVGDRVAAIAMGGMAEYVRVANAFLGMIVYKLPDEVSYEEAATIEPLATSLHATRKGKPAEGQTIVVFGAGIIGLGIIQCLKAMDVKFKQIIAVDVSDKRLAMAKQMGADITLNAVRENVHEKIETLAGTQPFMLMPEAGSYPLVDIVYDAVGYIMERPGVPVFQQAIHMAKEEGTVVVVGIFEQNLTLDLSDMVTKQVNIHGSFAYTFDDIADGIELIRSGKVDRKALVSHECTVDQCKEAFETQANFDGSVKVLIKP